MSKQVVQIQVRAILPTNAGCAVFVGNDEKVFVIYVDPNVGSAISMFINGTTKERPLTHDLIALILTGLEAKVERIVINDLKNGTYYGRMIISEENELHDKRKVIEIDARPSDCIAMAMQQKAPIYVSSEVWDEVEDMYDVLRRMREENAGTEEDDEPEE